MSVNGPLTLCSDFGLSDHFPGVMKGVILSINPAAMVVDITHGLKPFDVRRAAFVVENFHPFFPEGSVHVAVVDPGVGGERKPLVVKTPAGFFVGPDNGIFTSVFRAFRSFEAYAIENPEYTLNPLGSTFHGRDVFAPAAAHLSIGAEPSDMGARVKKPVIAPLPERVEFDGISARGETIYSDRFGNLITNIVSASVTGGAEIVVGEEVIGGVSGAYSVAEAGEPVAVRGSSGLLEIAVNGGSAVNLFGEEAEITVRAKVGKG